MAYKRKEVRQCGGQPSHFVLVFILTTARWSKTLTLPNATLEEIMYGVCKKYCKLRRNATQTKWRHNRLPTATELELSFPTCCKFACKANGVGHHGDSSTNDFYLATLIQHPSTGSRLTNSSAQIHIPPCTTVERHGCHSQKQTHGEGRKGWYGNINN